MAHDLFCFRAVGSTKISSYRYFFCKKKFGNVAKMTWPKTTTPRGHFVVCPQARFESRISFVTFPQKKQGRMNVQEKGKALHFWRGTKNDESETTWCMSTTYFFQPDRIVPRKMKLYWRQHRYKDRVPYFLYLTKKNFFLLLQIRQLLLFLATLSPVWSQTSLITYTKLTGVCLETT